MLAFTAAALMSAASITGYAAGSPTYDDNLILPNPASTPTTGSVVLVPVASPQRYKLCIHLYKHGKMQKLTILKLRLNMTIMNN